MSSTTFSRQAIDSLRYELVQPKYDSWKDSPFTGRPSHESDELWQQLQAVRGVWVTPEEAGKLNISGLMARNGTTATLLGVMHNLHCIRVVRQILYPEFYYPGQTVDQHARMLVHAGHCLEALRQSVMCTPDLTPRAVFWEDEERTNIAVNPSARQTCVVWDSLVQWERDREYLLGDLRDSNPPKSDKRGDAGILI